MRKVLKVKVIQPWIPVTERLPNPHTDVLVYFPKNNLFYVDYIRDGRFTMDLTDEKDSYYGAPSHWMPLPEVPHE